MKLGFSQIKDITTGASRIEDLGGRVFFSRFTDEQRLLYKNRDEHCYLRSLSSAGIKLSFSTNSERLTLAVETAPASSRTYFSVDVFSGDTLVGSLDNFDEALLPQKYTGVKCLIGKATKTFLLGQGKKDITVYLPWSMNTAIEELSLDDGAYVIPKKRPKTLLAFGDSITQGYDALRPSNSYVARLARSLDADEINKGIGGEVFFPSLAKAREEMTPDFITVAYGTNDWGLSDKQTFEENCAAFFENLRCTYASTKIYAITPLWRTDADKENKLGPFSYVEQTIAREAEKQQIEVIRGLSLITPDANLFADLFVHPRDLGFAQLHDNLYKNIMERGILQ